MRDVFVAGVGQVPVNRDGETRGRYLAARAIHAASTDAGLEDHPVDALLVGNMTAGILGDQLQLGSLVADYSGLAGLEAVTIEAACASGAAAARMGYLMVAGGAADVVLVCGVERMTHVDRERVTSTLATAADREIEGVRGESFLSLNARLMRAYIERYGARAEQFAPFSITAHENAIGNVNALFHKRIDLDDYMSSRMIIDPIRLYDVTPICNGAAALVLASPEAARRLRHDGRPSVAIAASASATAPLALERRADLLHLQAVADSTQAALRTAGLTRANLDLFELHDAYTIMSVLTLESAGFADPGTGTSFGTEGRIRLDGDLPISTLGGLKARGHPVGATGVYQLAEAYAQLTGTAGPNQLSGAEHALVQNVGGTASTVINHILRRLD